MFRIAEEDTFRGRMTARDTVLRRLFGAVVASVALACGSRAEPKKEPLPSATPAADASASEEQAALSPLVTSAPSAQAMPGVSAKPHVDTTTGASVRQGPSATVQGSGEVDGAALMKRHRDRIHGDHSAVTALAGNDPLDLGRRICEAVVPERPSATPVLLKPNLCGFDGMKDPAGHHGDNGVTGRTTDPEFVRGVIRCLKGRGFKHITVAESCGFSWDKFNELARISGYRAMVDEEGVPLVAMDDDGKYDVEGDKPGLPMKVTGIDGTNVPTLLLPKLLAEHLDHGLFISIPKIKMHRFAAFSLGIKAMQGTVMLSDAAPAFQQKWRMHKELMQYIRDGLHREPEDRAGYVQSLGVFAQRMATVLEISAPDVVLLEGAPAMDGDGFGLLVPVADKIAIGGTNPIAVDRVGAEFLGLWNNERLGLGLAGHKTSPLLEIAAKRFDVDINHVDVVGDGAPLISKPRPIRFQALAPFGIDTTPTPAH